MRVVSGWRRTLAAVVLACVIGLIAACSEVAVVTPTPSPTAAPSLPPIGFNHRYGNNPVAAADGFELERTLFARKDYWETALATAPLEAGYVDRANPGAVTTARAAVTELTLVIASEALTTIRSFLANGHPGQLSYCTALLDTLRTKGYTGLTKITVYIYFGEQDRHAVITWKQGGSYDLQVLDNDLKGTSINPNPSATPFQAPPSS